MAKSEVSCVLMYIYTGSSTGTRYSLSSLTTIRNVLMETSSLASEELTSWEKLLHATTTLETKQPLHSALYLHPIDSYHMHVVPELSSLHATRN